MKNLSKKVGSVVAKMALSATKYNVNSSCMFSVHQPKLPENAKKLRKF